MFLLFSETHGFDRVLDVLVWTRARDVDQPIVIPTQHMTKQNRVSSFHPKFLAEFHLLPLFCPPSPFLCKFTGFSQQRPEKPRRMRLTTAIIPFALLFIPLQLIRVLAQDGGISGATSSPEAAGYSCDPSKCRLPHCNCASTSPPGGLHPVSAIFSLVDHPLNLTFLSVRDATIYCVHCGRCHPIIYSGIRRSISRPA